MAVTAFIGLGSNLGNSAATVAGAMSELAVFPKSRLLARSSLYRSAPIAATPQPDYVNAVAQIATDLTAPDLLAALLALEARHGRRRSVADAPRTLDLDLLLYGECEIDQPGLKVPHPRMHQRAFVLAPLGEIAPACEIPGHGRAADCLARLTDQRIEIMT